MPRILPNTTTADQYPGTAGGAQIGIGDIFGSGFFVVANAAVFAQYFHGPRGQSDNSDELFLPPGTYPLTATAKDPLGGIRFRSAVTGTPAQVFGVLYYPDEATLLASSEFTAAVSPAGGITGGTGSVSTIFSTTLAAPAASILIPATGTIPSTFSVLQMFASLRGDNAGSDVDVRAQINGDVGANYNSQRMNGSGGAVAAAATAAAVSWQLGFCPAAAAAVGEFGPFMVTFPNYAAGQRVQFICQNYENNNVAQFIFGVGGSHLVVANLSTILLFPSAGNFAAGSKVILYGQ